MTYNLTLTSGFRSRSGSRLPRLWHPGPYRVPEDMSEEVAKQALDAGVAVREKAQAAPAREPPGIEDEALSAHGEAAFQEAAGGSADTDEEDDEDKPRKRGRPRKTPAPENKALKDAGENKSY